MMENLNKAVAIFTVAEGKTIRSDDDKQMVLREFAALNQFVIVGFLAVERANVIQGIKHAIDLCVATDALSVIFDEAATFSLPRKELLGLLSELSASGISIIFANDGAVINKNLLKTIEELFIASLKAENDLVSKKIKKSLMLKKRSGAKLGGRRYGSGLDETSVISQIIAFHKEGLSLQKICEALSKQDIKTVQNKRWHPTTIKRIIEREKNNQSRN